MIHNYLTLRELWLKKANNYVHLSRDRFGNPTKTLDQAYIEAQEDYGPKELDAFNLWLIKEGNKFESNPNRGATWADKTRDLGRECVICNSTCKINYPVYNMAYKEIYG